MYGHRAVLLSETLTWLDPQPGLQGRNPARAGGEARWLRRPSDQGAVARHDQAEAGPLRLTSPPMLFLKRLLLPVLLLLIQPLAAQQSFFIHSPDPDGNLRIEAQAMFSLASRGGFLPVRVTIVNKTKNDGKIDLLLTDVVLTGRMKGNEVASRLKEIRPDLCVLFMSGYTENAIVHRGRLDDGVQLIGKPFHREQIARKVAEVLGNAGTMAVTNQVPNVIDISSRGGRAS